MHVRQHQSAASLRSLSIAIALTSLVLVACGGGKEPDPLVVAASPPPASAPGASAPTPPPPAASEPAPASPPAFALPAAFNALRLLPSQPLSNEPYVSEAGTPLSPPVTQLIGSEGGELLSIDERVSLTVPAGAVAVPTEFSIVQVENNSPESFNAPAYRIGAPTDVVLLKPVELSFTLDDEDVAEFGDEYGIVMRSDDGSWETMPSSIETPTAVVQSLGIARRLGISASSTTRSVRGSPAGTSALNRDLSLTRKMLMLDPLFDGFLQSNQVGRFELRKWSIGKQIKKIATDGAPIVWFGERLYLDNVEVEKESASPLRYQFLAPLELPNNPTQSALEIFGSLRGFDGSLRTDFTIYNRAGWKGFIAYSYRKSVTIDNSRPVTNACFPYILCTYDSTSSSFSSGEGAISLSADIQPGSSPAALVLDINSWEGSFNLGSSDKLAQTAKRGPASNGKEGCLETSGEENNSFLKGKANYKPITPPILTFIYPGNTYNIVWSPPIGSGSGFESRKSYSTDCIQPPVRQGTRQRISQDVFAGFIPTFLTGTIDPNNPEKIEGLVKDTILDNSGQPVKVFVYWKFVKTRF